MPNEIITTKISEKSQSKTSKVNTKSKKEEPSLFDKMLKKSISKNTNETSIEKESTKTKDHSKTISQVITEKNTKISLFDKIKKDVKVETKSINTIEVTKENTEDKKVKPVIKKDDIKTSLIDTIKKDIKVEAKSINIVDNKEKNETNIIQNIGKEVESEVTETKINILSEANKSSQVIVKLENGIDIKDDGSSKNKKQEINKNTKKTSLLDSLVSEIKNKNIQKNTTTKNETIVEQKDENIKDKINAKVFLSNQQTKANIISKHHLAQSKEVLKDTTGIDAKVKIEKSAKILELNPSEIKIEAKENKKEILKVDTQNKINDKVQEQTTFLNKVLFKQAMIVNQTQIVQEKVTVASLEQSKESVKQIKAEDIDIKETTSQTAIQNITSKIISARQNMKSFMSDMARKMYENYKPPVTAFKINLNPAHLGSISITMKANKSENSLSISLNASQSSTLEVLEGSRQLLQTSLLKTFNSENNFSLDFSNNNDQSNNQENSKNNQEQSNSDIKDESDEIIENDISINDDYM